MKKKSDFFQMESIFSYKLKFIICLTFFLVPCSQLYADKDSSKEKDEYSSLEKNLVNTNAVKATHMNQLRTAIDLKRRQCSLPLKAWTDTTIVPGTTTIRTVHLEELRDAIADIYALNPLLTSPTLTDGKTRDLMMDPLEIVIKATHFVEILDMLRGAECCGDGMCNTSTGETIVSCPIDCECEYESPEKKSCGDGICGKDQIAYIKLVKKERTEDCEKALVKKCGEFASDPECGAITSCIYSDTCCSYSGGWTNKGCYQDGCKDPWRLSQTRVSDQGGDCPIEHRCSTANDEVCCTYSDVWDDADACGTKGCETWEKPYKRVNSEELEYCPDIPKCNSYHSDCCQYTGEWKGCGEKAPDDYHNVTAPGNEKYFGGKCAIDKKLLVWESSNPKICPNLYYCFSKQPDCYLCKIGEKKYCTTGGCAGTQTCTESKLWKDSSCVKKANTCTPGSSKSCGLDGSVQYCNACGDGYGSCGCAVGETETCTTATKCPGIRTCADGNFDTCQQANDVCSPGTFTSCQISDLPGQKKCNSCGTGYDSCRCLPGASLNCVTDAGCSGKRACQDNGVWSSTCVPEASVCTPDSVTTEGCPSGQNRQCSPCGDFYFACQDI